MNFTRLRLLGFKSFVDPVDLVIGAGMTGIVGPNGCGKSNLVEALRWVMGETSARRMRGADMDDVIFSGTTTRPSRNIAEVTVALDNSSRTAPAEFNGDDEIIVTRRLERSAGSDYRINGRPVRQKDVQLLFADQASGARSWSIVSQGQIDALIRARPFERKQILEEAAGTAGLETRRHEADLKLKAATQNLARLETLLTGDEQRLRSLKQQAKQAINYRAITDRIHALEALILHRAWQSGLGDVDGAESALATAHNAITLAAAEVAKCESKRAELSSEVPHCRAIEASLTAQLQKVLLARNDIVAEIRRGEETVAALTARLAETRMDHGRAENRAASLTETLQRLERENTDNMAQLTSLKEALPRARDDYESSSNQVNVLDGLLSEKISLLARAEAQSKACTDELHAIQKKCAELATKMQQHGTERERLVAEAITSPDPEIAAAMVVRRTTEVNSRNQQVMAAETALRNAQAGAEQSRKELHATEAAHLRLKAEADALRSLLNRTADASGASVIDSLTVKEGLEAALSAALGESLTASLATSGARYWREWSRLNKGSDNNSVNNNSINNETGSGISSPAVSQPNTLQQEGLRSLLEFVQAPAALHAALSMTWLADSVEQAERLANTLSPGNIIVTRDGWAWRWDGYTLTPRAKGDAAQRLAQRNRLRTLESELTQADAKTKDARAMLQKADAIVSEARDIERSTRDGAREALQALHNAQTSYNQHSNAADKLKSRIAACDGMRRQIEGEADKLRLRACTVTEKLEAMQGVEDISSEIAKDRDQLVCLRNSNATARAAYDRINQDIKNIAARISANDAETLRIRAQKEQAAGHLAELDARCGEITKTLDETRINLPLLTEREQAIGQDIATTETARSSAAADVIAAEENLSAANHALRNAESSLAKAREESVRAEAALEKSRAGLLQIEARCNEQLNIDIDDVTSLIKEDDNEHSTSALDEMLIRTKHSRDAMGAVNLRAEQEAAEAETAVNKLRQERDELVKAIARLREAIAKLSREARDRLDEAFNRVNDNFKELFSVLFGGGKAYLELTHSAEDDENCGLEIFASPPGKKTQILSLLSGGERTLTALALLFAVFRTNPAPICVLDEAEAALDESNVDRFCALVEQMARTTGTRFLIITHQRLTMARVDRLFGVTMAEKGVSKLVSVDLARAAQIAEQEGDYDKDEAA